ncbi:MAG: glycosyl hydrolase family 28-related protein [Acidobacteriaceae bacterium]
MAFPSPTLQNMTVDGAAILAVASSPAITITGGTVDGTIIGGTTPAAVHATTFSTTGAATLASVATAAATITGGTIDGTVIGGTTPAAAHATTLTASGTVSGTGITDLLAPYPTSATLAADTGSSLVGFLQAGTGAVAETVQAKLQQMVCVFDFMTAAQIASVQARDLTQDVTAAIQAAVNALTTSARLYFPTGTYKLTGEITVATTCTICGDGWTSAQSTTVPTTGTVFVCTFLPSVAANVFYCTASHIVFEDVEIFCNYQPADASGWVPTGTPIAIQFYRAPDAATGGDDGAVENVMVRGMSKGVFYNGADRGEVRLYGQTFGPLLDVDGCYDVMKIPIFHYWVFYASSTNILLWCQNNVSAIYLGRVDNPQFVNVFAFGVQTGVHYGPSAFSGTTGGGSQRGKFANIDIDSCLYGITFGSDALVTAQIGNLSVYNAATGTSTAPSRGIFQSVNQVVILNVANSDFDGSQGEAARLSYSGSSFNFGNLIIEAYNQVNNGYNALYTVAGSTISVASPQINTAAGNGAPAYGGGGTFNLPALLDGATFTGPVVLAPGTATMAPAKFTAGTNLTTPVDGSCEYDGAKYWKTVGNTRYRDVYSNSLALPSSITVGASPFVYQNTANYDADVLTSGGVVSLIEFSRDGTTWYNTGAAVSGYDHLSPNDQVRVTYTTMPVMTLIPR